VAPNKAIEDAIRIFAVYHQAINPRSRLYVVGSRYLAAYDAALDELVAELGLEDSVVFTGRIPDAELKTYFLGAHVYLGTSLHEGFCVPLVEAMHFGLPILARRAAAMPETLADAGVLFTRLGYEEVAEMVHFLVTDAGLRARIIDRQRVRLQELAPSRVEATLRTHLSHLGVPLPEGGTPPNPVGAGSPRPRRHPAEEKAHD
jgi:glycosyltransferase involved in cell wall biosynthesis